MKKILAVIISLTALSASADLKQLVIPVVRTSEQAPIVDGKMVPGEWERATQVTGFLAFRQADGKSTPLIPTLARRQTTAWLVADGEYLYLGFWSAGVPAGSAPAPATGKVTRYQDFTGGDRIEVLLAGPAAEATLRFVLDGTGRKRVETVTAAGATVAPVGWEGFSSIDEDGWTAEMRIRLQDATGKPWASGDQLRLNLIRGWQFPVQDTGLAVNGMLTASLVADAPAVKLEALGKPVQGDYDIRVGVREYEGQVNVPKQGIYDMAAGAAATAAKPSGAQAIVQGRIADAAGATVREIQEKLALVPATAVFAACKHSAVPPTMLNLQVTGPGGLVLYAAELPAAAADPNESMRYAARLKSGLIAAAWKLQAGFFPYWEKVKVKVILFNGELKENARTLRVTVTSDKGFSATRETAVLKGEADLVEVPIPKLPEGHYTAVAELLDTAGKVLAHKERQYTRKIFPWEHNQLGLSRGVIKPWTAMQVKEHTIQMWGREYRLGGNGLPAAMVSQGRDLLAGPVRLEGQAGGNALATTLTDLAVTFTEQAQDRVQWEAKSPLGEGLACRVQGTAEYDGYLWLELTLDPTRPVQMESLQLVIPYRDAAASLMHAQTCWARRSFSGRVPAGEGLILDSLWQKGQGSAFKNPAYDLAWVVDEYRRPGGFFPHLWLGSLTRGLSWFADSEEGWSLDRAKAAIELRRRGDTLELVLNLINRPCQIAKPRTIRFGLLATPVKALLPWKDIRTRAVNWVDAGKETGGKVTVFQDHMYAPYPLNFDYALADRKLKELTGTRDGTRLYFNKHELGAVLPEVATFDNEWGGFEPAMAYPGAVERFGYEKAQTLNRALTDSRIDMLVYYIAEMAKKTSLAGTYWDLTGIANNDLPMLENGTAYVDEETGKLVGTFDIRKSRQLWKRVATMWQEIRGEPDYMEIHSTNHINLPGYSFAYSLLNFEWLWPNEKERRADGTLKDFIDLRPLDLFATEGVPGQFGFWIASINKVLATATEAERRRIERSALALGGLHNHETGPAPKLGRRDQLEFVGYWDENRRITTAKPEFKASLWHAGQRFELVAVNLSLAELTDTVTLDLNAFGLKRIVKITDAETGAELPVTAPAAVTVTVAPHDCRLLLVEAE